jgi:DNA-binding transcriptional MerR regulator
MENATYSTGEAAQLAGVSAGTVRNLLGGRFAGVYDGLPWSEGAKPAKGEARHLSDEDVRMLAFIRSRTSAGVPHETIAQELRDGALDAFDWQPSDEPPPPRRRPEEQPPPASSHASLATVGPDIVEAVRVGSSELRTVMVAQLALVREAQARADALQADLDAMRERAATAEAQVAESSQLAADLRQAEARAVTAEAQAAELRAQLAEARLPFWRRWFRR